MNQRLLGDSYDGFQGFQTDIGSADHDDDILIPEPFFCFQKRGDRHTGSSLNGCVAKTFEGQSFPIKLLWLSHHSENLNARILSELERYCQLKRKNSKIGMMIPESSGSLRLCSRFQPSNVSPIFKSLAHLLEKRAIAVS